MTAASTGDQPPATTAKKPGSVPIGCLAWLGVLALLATIICGGYLTSSSGDDATSGAGAQVACEHFVRERLKAPSTAEFSAMGHSGGPVTYSVTGTVDAENAFGAKLRKHFRCTVALDGDDWVLRSLVGLDQ